MQRVAIARALVNKPSIILADEPTGNLDSHASHVIMEELAALHQQGNTILMVTHNPALTSYATRVINMLDGKIASDTKIKVKFTDETAAKIPLNFRTTAKVATTEDAVIGESIAVKPAKKKAESPATKRLRKSKRSKARSKK